VSGATGTKGSGVLPPREENIKEVLRSLKLHIFDLEVSLPCSAERERVGSIAQAIVLSASVLNELVALPELPRFKTAVVKKAAAKTN
jgi:hypothetical protein